MKNTLILATALFASTAMADGTSVTTTTSTNSTEVTCSTQCTRVVKGDTAPPIAPMSQVFNMPSTAYVLPTTEAAPAKPVPDSSQKPVAYGNGPTQVSTTDLNEPHGQLAGNDLKVWNQFCRGRNPAEVGEWRYNRCNGLDNSFKR